MDSTGTECGAVTRPLRWSEGESGFTLAGVIVIMTIMMIFVAYTVPRMWSDGHEARARAADHLRDAAVREAIAEFREKNNGAYPTSIDQLKEARQPRMIRGVIGGVRRPAHRRSGLDLVHPDSRAPLASPRNRRRIGTGRNAHSVADGSTRHPAAGGTVTTRSVRGRHDLRSAARPIISLNAADQSENWIYTIDDLAGPESARDARGSSACYAANTVAENRLHQRLRGHGKRAADFPEDIAASTLRLSLDASAELPTTIPLRMSSNLKNVSRTSSPRG